MDPQVAKVIGRVRNILSSKSTARELLDVELTYLNGLLDTLMDIYEPDLKPADEVENVTNAPNPNWWDRFKETLSK